MHMLPKQVVGLPQSREDYVDRVGAQLKKYGQLVIYSYVWGDPINAVGDRPIEAVEENIYTDTSELEKVNGVPFTVSTRYYQPTNHLKLALAGFCHMYSPN